MIDRTSTLDRFVHGWPSQHSFVTPCFELIHRAVHAIESRHMMHMLELLLPFTAARA